MSRRIAINATLALVFAASTATAAIAAHHLESEATAESEAIAITLDNFSFAPKDLELEAGKSYAFEFTNVGYPHDFTAAEFFAAAEVAPEDADKIVDGMVDVPSGTTVTIHLVPAAGSYEATCGRPGHADLGMTGSITVS
jgi:uncharacterized cupredoxin-like copper-binding protein